MSRGSLYFIIAALLAIIIAGAAYFAYEQSRQPALDIEIDEQGISVNGNG